MFVITENIMKRPVYFYTLYVSAHQGHNQAFISIYIPYFYI